MLYWLGLNPRFSSWAIRMHSKYSIILKKNINKNNWPFFRCSSDSPWPTKQTWTLIKCLWQKRPPCLVQTHQGQRIQNLLLINCFLLKNHEKTSIDYFSLTNTPHLGCMESVVNTIRSVVGSALRCQNTSLTKDVNKTVVVKPWDKLGDFTQSTVL